MPAACPQRIPQWKLWKIATIHLKLGVYPANQVNLITRIDQNSSSVKAPFDRLACIVVHRSFTGLEVKKWAPVLAV